jgi:sugar O-acyltransferase (sialic acid O-acetyltransferase NeuD family)
VRDTAAVTDLYGVYGLGGCGREAMPVARAMLGEKLSGAARLVFVDDHRRTPTMNGHSVLTYAEFLATPASTRHVNIAIADSRVRQRITELVARDGVRPFSIIADTAVLLDDVDLGEGAMVQPLATLGSNIVIGRAFQANVQAYVGHDCVLGDYVTFAPNAVCGGNVRLEDHVYVGLGASIRQGGPGEPLVIGAGAIIGMGAVVTRSVAAGATVVGNPARVMDRA